MTEVVRTHGGRIFATVLRLLPDTDKARDAFQEGMLAAWKSLRNYEGKSLLSTWVHRVVVNHALMRLRRAKHATEQSLDELLPAFTDYGHFREQPREWQPAAVLERAETRGVVRACIARLPEQLRIPLVLRDLQGLELPEVAELLDATPNAVKIRIHRARRALKALLEPHLGELTT